MCLKEQVVVFQILTAFGNRQNIILQSSTGSIKVELHTSHAHREAVTQAD